MIKASVATSIGAPINKTTQNAIQADGITPLHIVGETHLTLTRDNSDLEFEALVVSDMDVDVLAGIPFMTTNDISVRPSRHQIVIGGSTPVFYGPKSRETPEHLVRRTQAYVLKSSQISTVVWPGSFAKVDIPKTLDPEATFAIEPRIDNKDPTSQRPQPNIIEAIGVKVRILNHTQEPLALRKNEHFSNHFNDSPGTDNTTAKSALQQVTRIQYKQIHTTSSRKICETGSASC